MGAPRGEARPSAAVDRSPSHEESAGRRRGDRPPRDDTLDGRDAPETGGASGSDDGYCGGTNWDYVPSEC